MIITNTWYDMCCNTYGICGKVRALKRSMATCTRDVALLCKEHVCPGPVWKPACKNRLAAHQRPCDVI